MIVNARRASPASNSRPSVAATQITKQSGPAANKAGDTSVTPPSPTSRKRSYAVRTSPATTGAAGSPPVETYLDMSERPDQRYDDECHQQPPSQHDHAQLPVVAEPVAGRAH